MTGIRVVVVLVLVTACTPRVPFAASVDANVDVWWDPNGPRGGPGVMGGGGTPDAGHRDTGAVTTGCDARILVIFDRSSSMAMPWTSGGASEPRWQAAEMALASAVMSRESQLTVGAILFPSSDGAPLGSTCATVDGIAAQIPFESGSAFLSTWSATWSSPTLYGSTPIDAAFEAADAALASAGTETGVVLITDGEPTCSGAIDATTYASRWHARGISTWVVGLPGSEAATSYLANIATAGGTSVLSVDDPSALASALAGIAGTQVDHQCSP